MQSSHESTSLNNRLQAVNYANVAGYILNALFVFGAPSFGLQDNATLSAKYQTLVTPAGYAFGIWGIIFTSQFIWSIVQCFPSFRSEELVVKGVGYNFVWACLAQALWTVAFGLEKIPLSLAAMVLILIPLVMIVTQFAAMQADNVAQYWLLKFPFEIHAAWIMAATLVNINVLFVAESSSAHVQTAVGWASLAVVVLVGLFYTLKKTWVVPCVLVWASVAISNELSSPKDLIVATFSQATIQYTKASAASVAALLLVAMLTKIIFDRFAKKPETNTNEQSLLEAD